jgi:hypothetical protein
MTMTMATAMTTMPTARMVAMATNDDGKVEQDGDDKNNNDNDDVVNIDVVEDDDDDRTTMMRWRQVRLDDNDAMAMGGQRHTERSRAPRHPSEATINLC